MKNTIQFFYLLLLSLFTFLSCDQENEDTNTNCDAINALEIVASLNEAQQTDAKVPYTFTINNTSLSNLAFEWYIDGQLQENSNDNSSLFNFDFTENGTYEICLQPLATNNIDCELKKVCTSLTLDNFPEENNDQLASEEIEGPQTEDFNCFDSEFNVFHSQKRKESYFGFSPYLYSPADDISYTWFLDGAELSHEERIQLSGRSLVLQFSSIMKLCNGQHTVSVNVISPTVCPNGTTYTKTFGVDYNIKDCSGNEITPQNEPTTLTCNNIDFTARVQPHFDGATFHASYIKDATYTWFVNGNEIPESQLPSSNRQGVSDQVKVALKTLQFFKLGTGTHTVKVTIVSPSICPNGTTLSQTVTLP